MVWEWETQKTEGKRCGREREMKEREGNRHQRQHRKRFIVICYRKEKRERMEWNQRERLVTE